MAAYSQPNENKPMKEGAATLREGLAEVRRDAGAIKEDLGVLKDDAIAMGTHAAHGAADVVRHGAHAATGAARSLGDSMKDVQSTVKDCIAERPMTTLLVAVGIGLIAGRLLSKR